MINKEQDNRYQYEMMCIDEMVPKNHLLRKIEKAVDFKKIYEITDELYCADNGRPNVDAVVLFKMVLIQHLFGIASLRRTHAEIEVNIAYRWFLGYSLSDKIPHFSTVSHNFKHRYSIEVIDKVFEWILGEIANKGYLSPEAVFIDGTHIKANANIKKAVKKAVPEASKIYEEELMKEINADREAHGKKPLKEDKKDDSNDNDENNGNGDDSGTPAEGEKIITVSTTDPECGVFHKGEHKKCMAYAAQTACDKHGYIMGVTVNPGNVHDSVAFDGLYEELCEKHPEFKVVVADSAYKTPWICKRIIDDNRVISTAYKRPMSKDGFYKPYEYIYDEYNDFVICPENQTLRYATTNRDGYQEFRSDKNVCASCPSRECCTNSKNCKKTVARHLWADYLEKAEDFRHTFEYADLYELRKETIERVFADAKEKHAMRYTRYIGLLQVTKWVKLKFAAMNLKKLALHTKSFFTFFYFLPIILPRFIFETGFFYSLSICESKCFLFLFFS